MVLPGHIAGGYLATTALLSLSHGALTPLESNILLSIGTLAGEGPDIDVLIFWFMRRQSAEAKKKDGHRDYITHIPFAWLIGCFVISAVGFAIGSPFIEYLGAVIFCGAVSHFILDSIEYGIKWLWPFSDRRFCIKTSPQFDMKKEPGSFAYYAEYVRKFYIKSPTFYVEILVTALAVFVALRG